MSKHIMVACEMVPEENKYGGIQRWAVEGYLGKSPSKTWCLS